MAASEGLRSDGVPGELSFIFRMMTSTTGGQTTNGASKATQAIAGVGTGAP